MWIFYTGKDCLDILERGYKEDGIYFINPDSSSTLTRIFCDQLTNGGGWAVFQRRVNSSQDFLLAWDDYRQGFGNLNKGFWLGNNKLHRLSLSSQDMLIELTDTKGNTKHASYGSFFIGPESEKYILSVGTYSGSAGDSLHHHNKLRFTTKDIDNDEHDNNCAKRYTGAWWYKDCYRSNLNGQYGIQDLKGITWHNWNTKAYDANKAASMKLRPARGKTNMIIIDY